ncbi:PDZ domain-containing protein [Jeotgalibacillus haloalkalitolerans]|uniref:PDZ domain-containing protein n=1 Tax=Jeotgalibacillus haloalkalitolerans TaxID=3104292 RepID=A0ABU5KJR9_9BACL|nr:PDZ domain-containing protein [Jeotgalibacillus sp. HH7-29]MDZ5711507.1 PDZ domain-containing protein [Jeotgalibacillus sp. HH7-29]
MFNEWLSELPGALLGLLNPVLLIGIIAAIVAGTVRLKRERRDVRTAVKPWYIELLSFFGVSLAFGLVLSAVISGAGIVVDLFWIYAVSLAMILFTIIGQFRLLSAGFMFPLVFVAIIGLDYFNVTLPELVPALPDAFIAAGIVMGLLLIAEGLMIQLNAVKQTSPRVIRTPRGMKAGAFFTKRIWLVPLLIPVPTGLINEAGWWPLIGAGDTFSLFIFPAVLGYQLTVVHDLPKNILKSNGAQVVWLGFLSAVIAAGTLWAPYLIFVSFGIAFAGRLFILLKTRAVCRKSGYHFLNGDKGVMIIDVLPGTPAAKMGLMRGEMVHKVNGLVVRNEREFYEAIQKSRAHCKLEVFNHAGEVRYTQAALYEGQHHQLGCILIEDRKRETA